MLIPAPLRFLSFALALTLVAVATLPAQPTGGDGPRDGAVETVLKSRNTSALELTGNPVSLKIDIRSQATGKELVGEIAFTLEGDETLQPTDSLTCTPSLASGCGVVIRFSAGKSKQAPPTVLEAQLDDGVFRITDSRAFETFVQGLVDSDSAAIKVRVDQQREFLVDMGRIPWPLAAFGAEHPFARRFSGDPVLAALRERYPAQYLKIVTLVRKEVPDKGTLSPEAERKILDTMHSTVARLRPMVSDELLERIVVNASASAKAVGARDVALCNALAVAARSAVTAPELKETQLAREEYQLWQQVVEQASPRFIRKVPNEELLPSTPRFEDNVRIANEAGCGMFAAVIDGILMLPREERRQWLRATVGTVEDPRAPPANSRRQ